jgi:hypothetical protein
VRATSASGTPNGAALKKRCMSAGWRLGAAFTMSVYMPSWLTNVAGGCPVSSDWASSKALTVSPWPPGRTFLKPP